MMTFCAWQKIIIIFGLLGSAVGCSPATPAVETESVTTMETPTQAPALEQADLVNPGFEEKEADGVPAGWVSSGDESAVLLETNGYSG